MSWFKRKHSEVIDVPPLTIEQAKSEIMEQVEAEVMEYLQGRRFFGTLSDGGTFDIHINDTQFAINILVWDFDWGGRR